eukprot:TRINITY_DN29058_c0_g1_i1.p1 TRINITY_DN29058_c0_g1~~TRINITY_DN29058_c0_g1_i1.p1  ORF type:complete len:352 (-),score=52.23 TRINITY_DN29058_c0_g1_i1:150-1205(-)
MRAAASAALFTCLNCACISNAFVSPTTRMPARAWTAAPACRISPRTVSMVLEAKPPSEVALAEPETKTSEHNFDQEQISLFDHSADVSGPSVQQRSNKTLAQLYRDFSSDPKRRNAVLNLLVVGALVGGALYKVVTVDADLSRGWTIWEIILRVPSDNLWSYESSVTHNAVPTKAATSMVAYGIGDFLAQCLRGETLETIDLKRTARSAAAGLFVHGPMCHFWIEWMQANLDFDGAWWNFLPKVVADQTVYSLVLNAAYTSFVIGLSGEKKPSEILDYVKTTCVPAITSSWRFWPLIHCLSFSTLIPKDFKLLFIDLMEIIWVTILSSVANKDQEAVAEGGPGPEGGGGLH